MAKTYETKVKGLGTIHKIEKPFDESLKTIKGGGANVISARDLAYTRIEQGRNSSLCKIGSYIKEGVAYVPDKTLFIRNSPLLNQRIAQKAVQAHRRGEEFYIENKLIDKYQEQAEQDKNKSPEKRRVLVLNERGKFEIPTNKFKDKELTLWLFKDLAEAYGNFLSDNKINEMPVYLTENNEKMFANQLWFGNLDNRPDLFGHIRSLDCNGDVRGLWKETNKSRKLPYTSRQVEGALKTTENVMQGKAGTLGLESVIKFLERLKE